MSTVGHCRVAKIDGRPVVQQADPLIYADRDFLDEIGLDDERAFTVGELGGQAVRYRVLCPSANYPAAMLCERVE